ncbi:glycoside hydrolase family 97 protein [Sphingomonas sp.]|jgi:alpha-glucosidase|uniref:glycoside hydrolase family 97 protein n=1 Tax=Sphingomonas sp. TaxID=28214 RepID=UPI002EDBA36B
MKTLVSGLLLAWAAPASADTIAGSVTSPDGTTTAIVTGDAGGMPMYAIERHGEIVIAPSALGFEFDGAPQLSAMKIDAAAPAVAHDSSYAPVAGKSATARDHYNEMRVTMREAAGEGRRLELIVRAYDGGIAFRYHFPEQPAIGTLRIRFERTQFRFPADYACWGLNIGRYDTAHEGEFRPVHASQILAHTLYDTPLSCTTPSGKTSFVIAEADLRDYAGMYLAGRGEGGLGVETSLSPRRDQRGVAVIRSMGSGGIDTPWRVVMTADRAGDLIESDLIATLNPPTALADTSWIKPGKFAWDWWSGPYLPPPAKAAVDDATIRRYIDFAASSKLAYMLIDEGWYWRAGGGGNPNPDADMLRQNADIDVKKLVAYAAQRGVGVMLWAHWSLIDRDLDATLAHVQALGVKGLKIDFMDRDDQQMVDFYHRLLTKAGERRLLIDLHGAYRPTGLIRTYPHYLTQEGVLGAEYNKWSSRITATHNVTLPYTRMVLGPMDYTPGGLRNRTPQTFERRGVQPQVQTTRGQALAMYVVYDSPLQAVADSPDVYAGTDALAFISDVPTTWDETRFIAGEIGQSIVLARRKGRDWYVGAMTNEAGRTIAVPLTFLGRGRFAATIRQDGSTPVETIRTTREGLAATDALTLTLAPSGGAVVKLSPAGGK